MKREETVDALEGMLDSFDALYESLKEKLLTDIVLKSDKKAVLDRFFESIQSQAKVVSGSREYQLIKQCQANLKSPLLPEKKPDLKESPVKREKAVALQDSARHRLALNSNSKKGLKQGEDEALIEMSPEKRHESRSKKKAS